MASLVQQGATEEVPHLHKAPAMSHLYVLRLQLVTLTSLRPASERAVLLISHMLTNVHLLVSAPAVGKQKHGKCAHKISPQCGEVVCPASHAAAGSYSLIVNPRYHKPTSQL